VLAPDFDPELEQVRLDEEFALGRIPFTVSSKLPSMPTDPAITDMNSAVDIDNTFAELQSARNTAFKKGRAPIGSTQIESPTKSAPDRLK
jgi:hypothetical protein